MGLLEKLSNGIVLGDGAMGTLLYSGGLHSCFEELNITERDRIIHIHEQYIDAGAEVIQTNSYGANAGKLRQYGLEKLVKQINQMAVRNARAASKGRALVIGGIGGMKYVGSTFTTPLEREMMLLEQASALLEEGVDGIMLETFYDENELYDAVNLLRGRTDLPIISQVTLQEIGIMQSGQYIEKILPRLVDLGADVVGINCHLGPLHMLESLNTVSLPTNGYLSAFPNSGLPLYAEGKYEYKSNPEYFEDMAKPFIEQGVRLIGGCCGTTPAHIAALRKKIDTLKPVTKKEVKSRTIKITIPKQVEQKDETLPEKAKQKTTIIAELDPPKTLQTRKFFEGARALHSAGADAITLADNPLASPRISNVAMASLLQRLDVPVLTHLTCRDRNMIGLQSHLMGLSTLGLNEILAITGDPARVGDFPGATSVYDVASLDLIRMIKEMNEGRLYSGKSLGNGTRFSVAAAFNPNIRKFDAAIKRLEKKVEAGADYFLTQPIYDFETIDKLYEATRHIKQPIFIGVMPLVSKRNADFIHYEVPGITLSDEVRNRISSVEPEKAIDEGKKIAKELINYAKDKFNGIYLITPFLKYEITEDLIHFTKSSNKEGIQL
ncbi:bifunctional homocysteine S-methyltransferase/methylenetetrahydrofolate reductase [Arthrobacter citreus]|nr:bifunctional homocysteine S-methyltransferase/methylenetetrahydrofolate reductase [Arthrobacter citreus]